MDTSYKIARTNLDIKIQKLDLNSNASFIQRACDKGFEPETFHLGH